MMKVVMGYVRVDSEENMEVLSEIVNDLKHESQLTIEEEEADFLIIDNIEYAVFDKLKDEGFLSQDEYDESEEVDSLKFYLD